MFNNKINRIRKYRSKKNACVCKTLCPCGNKVRKSYFYNKGQSQGHKVIDLGVS